MIVLNSGAGDIHMCSKHKAAPDIYEALKEMLFQFATAVERPYSKDEEVCERANKALAKAEGKGS